MKQSAVLLNGRRHWAVLFVLISLGFIVAGVLFYRFEADRIRRERYLDLKTIAEFKADQIREWRRERLADVTKAARSPFLVRAFGKLSEDPVVNGRDKDLKERFELERTYSGYADVLVVSAKGHTLFSLDARSVPLSREDRGAMAESMRHKSAVLSEPYRASDGKTYMDAVAPVAAAGKTYVIFYRIDADTYLYPLVKSWPGPSRSAETLLVRRDGDDALFLNDLRHRGHTALSLRYPLTRTDTPAVQAVLGARGMFLGRDYRDTDVMADLRPIPESPWYMVAKVDTKEVLSEATYRAGVISFAVFLFLLLGGLITAYTYRLRQAFFYKTLYASEREQRESHELFRTTLYSIGDAVITTASDGTVREMNRVAEKLTGWSESDAKGRAIQEIFHIINEESRGEVENPVAHVLRAGTVVGLANHTVLVAKDGAERPIADSGAPIVDDSGTIVGVVMVFRDQTEERSAEAALRESKARLDLALESAHMGAWHWDLTRDKRHFDDQVCRLLGIDPGAFTGTPEEFFNSVHPDDREKLQATLARTIEEDIPYEPEYRAVWPDGSVHCIAARGRMVRDDAGRPARLNGIVWDITERTKSETALRQSEAKFRSYVEFAPLAVFVADREGRIVDFNPAATELLGYDAATLSGMQVWEMHPIEEREGAQRHYAAFVRDGHLDTEFRFQKKDGSLAWVSLHANLLSDDSSLAYCLDITDRKKLEEQLIQAQKMEAVGTLAGGVAHDFNNILTVIMGLGNVIQMTVSPDDRVKPLVDQIVLSSERAADLTQSLLAFSRKQRIRLEPHQVSGVVTSTAKLLKRLLTEDITLSVDEADGGGIALLDISQINQVLMNLATNARDAMPNGGSLTIRTATVYLDETFRKEHGFGKPGTYVRLSVSDTGIGMDEKTMANIFDPFFTTKEVGKGTGLGLASAYGIIKQHNGYVTVSSSLLKGTTFDIYLPLADMAVRSESAAATAVRGGSETILVLEDDSDVRNMIRRILSDSGYTTLEAANGDDAIRVFNENKERIDLVVLDVVMPGKNGREVLDEFTRINPRVKAIFMSGYTGDIVIDKGVRQESVDFLQKPLSVTSLLAKVREVLDRP